MRPATKDGGNGFGSGWQRLRDLAGAEEAKMGEKRPAAKFSNQDPLGLKGMAIATEVPTTEARRGGAGEEDGDDIFSWGRRRSTMGAVVGEDREVGGFLAFNDNGGSREIEKRGRAGEGGHGGRGGGRDDERRWRRGRSESKEGGAAEEVAMGCSDATEARKKRERGNGGGGW